MRISDKTSPEMVWSLLTEIWNLKPPTLVLSLLGGNGSDTLNSKIKLSLEEGLPKVSNKLLLMTVLKPFSILIIYKYENITMLE